MAAEIEVSVIIPCLNEAGTVAASVRQAISALSEAKLDGEVIVADNGSTDGSRELAAGAGARVVPVSSRGYGHALMGGIAAARANYIIMGDGDGSYDFGEVPNFVAALREGYDLVQGCRFPSGGGRIEAGAMRFMHRRIGNPLLTRLARLMFGTRLNDIYCGLRGFNRGFIERAELRCTGMEFATEMIIRAAQLNARVTEIPIVLSRDGREGRPSHLRTFRDGWRTLRLFLLNSPSYLFLAPGMILIGLGVLGSVLALQGAPIGPATLGVHTLLVSSLLILVGAQSTFMAIFAFTFALVEKLRPGNTFILKFYRYFNLEIALAVAGIVGIVGTALIATAFLDWRAGGYGPLDYSHSLRIVIPGFTLMALAALAIISSFMVSILGLDRK